MCDNPRPQYGGLECVGENAETRQCTKECPGATTLDFQRGWGGRWLLDRSS